MPNCLKAFIALCERRQNRVGFDTLFFHCCQRCCFATKKNNGFDATGEFFFPTPHSKLQIISGIDLTRF